MSDNPTLQGPDGEYMTLRDYFAASALTGLSGRPAPTADASRVVKVLTEAAYEIADAMMKERNSEG